MVDRKGPDLSQMTRYSAIIRRFISHAICISQDKHRVVWGLSKTLGRLYADEFLAVGVIHFHFALEMI